MNDIPLSANALLFCAFSRAKGLRSIRTLRLAKMLSLLNFRRKSFSLSSIYLQFCSLQLQNSYHYKYYYWILSTLFPALPCLNKMRILLHSSVYVKINIIVVLIYCPIRLHVHSNCNKV